MKRFALNKWLSLAGLAGLLGGNLPLGWSRGIETKGPVKSRGFRRPRWNSEYISINGAVPRARRVKQLLDGHYQIDR